MASELTGLDLANASMLDEATAAAEAMTMSLRLRDGRNIFFISETCHPQTIEVVRARAHALGIEVVIGNHENFSFSEKVFGALVQYPDTFGAIHDFSGFAEKAHAAGAMLTVATDLLALTLIKPPGEFGADIAVGSAQRFGVPLGYGCLLYTSLATPSPPELQSTTTVSPSSGNRRFAAAKPDVLPGWPMSLWPFNVSRNQPKP